MVCAYAPPHYPHHDYSGEGEIVTIRLGDEIVGFLSRKDWTAVNFNARPDLSDLGHFERRRVFGTLRDFAYDGRPMVDAWAEILNKHQHDKPVIAPLGGLEYSG